MTSRRCCVASRPIGRASISVCSAFARFHAVSPHTPFLPLRLRCSASLDSSWSCGASWWMTCVFVPADGMPSCRRPARHPAEQVCEDGGGVGRCPAMQVRGQGSSCRLTMPCGLRGLAWAARAATAGSQARSRHCACHAVSDHQRSPTPCRHDFPYRPAATAGSQLLCLL